MHKCGGRVLADYVRLRSNNEGFRLSGHQRKQSFVPAISFFLYCSSCFFSHLGTLARRRRGVERQSVLIFDNRLISECLGDQLVLRLSLGLETSQNRSLFVLVSVFRTYCFGHGLEIESLEI